MHPDEFVTVNVYVPAGIAEIVELFPEPEEITPPGLLVIVQVPGVGNPLKIMLPVDRAHVG